MKLFKHQNDTANFIAAHDRVFVTSSPGTGKTISVIEGFKRKKAKKMLVLAPLSILRPSWGDDITKFAPELSWSIARGKHRNEIISSAADIVITNHDAVKWLAKLGPQYFIHYDMLCIDEFTAYKNASSQRSKACLALSRHFAHIVQLSGTPISNNVLDIWHPAFINDQGERLGANYYNFRFKVCMPKQIGPHPTHLQWIAKPGAEELIADWLRDITIRHRFEDCVDIPANTTHTLFVDLPHAIRMKYKELAYSSYLETKEGALSAIHAGARIRKLLQLLSGAVYDNEGNVLKIHKERYELVIQLVKERQHSLVAFNWKHERDALMELAKKENITYGIIDGSTSQKQREEVVRQFQAGELQTLFAHPQSASHGLTLTKGTATIWCSPTYNAEHYQQFNQRIYRTGQSQKTETILIAARDTKEEEVYAKLNDKLYRMDNLLDLFTQFTSIKEAS